MKGAFAVFAAGAVVGLIEVVDTFLPEHLQLRLGIVAVGVVGIELLTLLGISLAGHEEGLPTRVRIPWARLPVWARVALAGPAAALAVLLFAGNQWAHAAVTPLLALLLSGIGAWQALRLRNHRRALADPPFPAY